MCPFEIESKLGIIVTIQNILKAWGLNQNIVFDPLTFGMFGSHNCALFTHYSRKIM